MIVWRLCKKEFADLSGRGAYLYGGRWNSPGHSVIYTASSLSLACLEIIAGIGARQFPHGFVSLKIEIPDDIKPTTIHLKDFPSNWREASANPWFLKKGNAWVKDGKTLSLTVPSVIIPTEMNVIINANHPEIHQIKVREEKPFAFDPRLIQ